MTAVFAAPVILVGTGGKVLGWSTFPDGLNLRDDVEIAGKLCRAAAIHRRGDLSSGRMRLEVIEVRVSSAVISRRDNAVLALANRDLPPGQLANEIRLLGMTETRFYQRLNHLINDPGSVEAALLRYPMLVNRLRRLQDQTRRPGVGGFGG